MKPSQLVAKGWCQRVRVKCDEAGIPQQWCLLGAVDAIYPSLISEVDRNNIFTYLMNKLNVKYFSDLIGWNDDPERTQAEVVELLQSVGE